MSAGDTPRPPRTRPTRAAVLAAALVGLEALGLAALAIWQVVALVGGDVVSGSSATALIVLTAVVALLVFAFAVGVLTDQSWGRSGGIMTQLLLLAVAVGAMTGQYANPGTGLVLAVPAVVCLVLLFLLARRSIALRRANGEGRADDGGRVDDGGPADGERRGPRDRP